MFKMDTFLSNLILNKGAIENPLASILLFVVVIWSFVWKGFGLWNSAKNEDKYWFVAILVLNTVGILEIIYLFFFEKHQIARSFAKKNFNKYLKRKA